MTPVYLFRDPHFAAAGDTIVCAAPIDAVVKAYGGGGLHESAGLESAFGGAAAFSDDTTGERYLGVWGARKASEFRTSLKNAGLELEVIAQPPPGRLIWYSRSHVL